MKNPSKDQFIGIPIKLASGTVGKLHNARGFLPDPANHHSFPSYSSGCSKFTPREGGSVLKQMNKKGKKADSFAQGFREHFRLGARISETVKGKFSLGAKILQVGGVEKVFRQLFSVTENERLLKAYQCYLSTTAGPIAGLLFISTDKVAFCSERSLKLSSPDGKSVRVYYKVLIPVTKIRSISPSENMNKPSQKYLEIVTEDNFDFWFMGFLNYQKTFKYLQKAILKV